ncbi:unnamed protein product [Hyaloperonospora brassicae]|uniref:C2H2-type domain-containing protein n=1 Tax=Hyaloperonospora brassicae TaxID=162125 RepID=A0AAV0UEI7_HYABA|nr:unnamed protein product [Hyaloperonospora brassicae]
MTAADALVFHRPKTVAGAAGATPAAVPQGDGDEGAAANRQTQKRTWKSAREEREESREVHEVTESSSDESVDETVSRPHNRTMVRTREQYADGAEVTARIVDNNDEDEMPTPEVVERMRQGVYMPDPEEVCKAKSVADMSYLFTNDKLKEESPAIVLRSDPFCIPRVTDNVPNYRPMLNPLSIFLGEDQLLPGNYRLDPSERPPKANEEVAMATSMTEGESDGLRGRLLPLPSNPSLTSSALRQFRGKTSTFMGTMPRQLEFTEISVSETLFQNHEVFRLPPPMLRIPTSSARDIHSLLSMDRNPSNTSFSSTGPESDQTSALFVGDRAASLSDAMLLSSIQRTLDVTTVALASNDSSLSSPDIVAESVPSVSEETPMCQIQPLQPLDFGVDTLTNHLPSRSMSMPNTSSPVYEAQYSSAEGCKPTNSSMGYSAGASCTLGALLSPIENQASTSYGGLFTDSSESQLSSQTMQSFSSALGLFSITTPPNGVSETTTDLTTPQERSSGGSLRRSGAKRSRAKNVFRPCTFSGCTKGARGKSGRCQKHGGGKRCAAPDCPKGAQGSSTMCLFHGGGYRCTVEGCSTGARGTSGLCAKHGGYRKGKSGIAAGERELITDGAPMKRLRTNDSLRSAAAVTAE